MLHDSYLEIAFYKGVQRRIFINIMPAARVCWLICFCDIEQQQTIVIGIGTVFIDIFNGG